MVLDRFAGCGTNRGLEHRIDLYGGGDAPSDLVGMVHLEVFPKYPIGGDVVGDHRPRQIDPGLPGPESRSRRLGSGEDDQVDFATLDFARRGVDQRLGTVAAHRRQPALAR